MKPYSSICLCLLFSAFPMVSPSLTNAQTVSIGAISASHFCTGDSVTVDFTVTGFFAHNNAFTLQLSDSAGNFLKTFRSLASLKDTVPGNFSIRAMIPLDMKPSAHYRFRVLSPILVSQRNDNDIQITVRPLEIGINSSASPMPAVSPKFVGLQSTFYGSTTDGVDSLHWDFGLDATPRFLVTPNPSEAAVTTFQAAGDHTLAVTAGTSECSLTTSYTFHVYDCSSPIIPHDAIVADSDGFYGGDNRAFWVNPGVNAIIGGDRDTIFAEAGASISGNFVGVLYLKSGASFTGRIGEHENLVIFGSGTSITNADEDYKHSCPNLDFDYTKAPPNAAHPLAVAQGRDLAAISLFPNPTAGSVSIQNLPVTSSDITVLNILGETVLEMKNVRDRELTLDFSKFSSGTYYIRIASVNSVMTKMVVRQ